MQVWVQFLSGGRRGETVPLNIPGGGSITVGRADDNHIVLPASVDVAASSHHCELRNQNNALVLVDSNSTNGTWVYGQRVTTVPLASGIRVTFGRGGPEAEIFFQPDTAGAAPEAPQQAPVARTAPQMAIQSGYGAPAPAPAIPRQGDPCGICGQPLGADMWMCYGCKKGLCASHFDASARTCVVCSGAMAAPAPGYAQAPRCRQPTDTDPMATLTMPARPMPAQQYAQQQQGWGAAAPAAGGWPQQQQQQQQGGYAQQGGYPQQGGYAQQGGGGGGPPVDGGCEICGASSEASFVCMGCTRCVCETHRDRGTGMCEQCASAPQAQGYR
jgi:hypothetical protein